MSEIELLPCPACSEQSSVSVQETKSHCDADYIQHGVHCLNCSHALGANYDTREDAIAAWNSLPRALTWTTEPPKVTGWYLSRTSGNVSVQFLPEKFIREKGAHALQILGSDEWAGPIPQPKE